MIDSLPTILLCFYTNDFRKCRSLTRRNDGALGNINNFVFDSEFKIDQIVIPNTTYEHGFGVTIGNYQGFPLVLGSDVHNLLEILITMENPPRWIRYEGTDYPYSDT